jgi:TolA-binding protein
MQSSLRLRLRLLISLSLLLAAGLSAQAQFYTAEDFFNSGAQFYLSNNIPLAKERTESGLQIYPNDDKLKKLEELLNKQQQSQNNQSQQNQQSQSQQQKQQQQQQQQQSSQSQAEKDKEQQAKKDAEQKKEQEEKQAQEKPKDDADKSASETNEVNDAKGAHPMTPKEAERLLDARKDSEQYLSLKPKGKPEQPNHPVKDW